MASALVAGRVDEKIKQRADAFIKRAGTTQAEVIRTVWHNIAATGEIPVAVSDTKPATSLTDRLERLREKTPRSKFVEELTPQGLKEELGNRG